MGKYLWKIGEHLDLYWTFDKKNN